MKRRTITFLSICMTMTLFAGCGAKEPAVAEGTEIAESVTEENTESSIATESEAESETVSGEEPGTGVRSTDIEYNVDDYVILGDYMDVSVTLDEADYEITEEDVNNYVDEMIDYVRPYIPDTTKNVVEKGDIVDVDYVGKKDGIEFENGSAQAQIIDTATNSNPTTGSGYIEGFSDGLIGMKVGETRDWEVTFPAEYPAEDLKGQKVVFTFKVNSICTKVTRENIDDAYVSEFFGMSDVEQFYSEARAAYEQEIEGQKETDARNAIIQEVINKCEVTSYPEGMLEARTNEYVEIFEKQYCADGMELEEYLQTYYGMTVDQFKEQGRTYMENNLIQELIFEAIAKKENVQFDEDQFAAYVSMSASTGGFPSEDVFYETYGPDKESGKKYLEKMFVQMQAYELIAEKAKVNYVASGTDEGITEETVAAE